MSRQQYSRRTLDEARRQAPFADSAFGYTDCCGQAILTHAQQSAIVERQYVTGDYFAALGVRPVLGRLLTVTDDQAGATPVAVTGYGLWRERFGGRNDIVGAKICSTRRR